MSLRQVTLEELHKMHYYKELLPLHKRLIQANRLSKPTSMKREYIEKRIYAAIGTRDANRDTGLLRANVKACEEERARNKKYIDELEEVIVKMNKLRSRATF